MNTTELTWFKSSYSSGSGDSCVEVAMAFEAIRIRDSKVEDGPQLAVTSTSWTHFLSYAAQV
ncbi:DUF397 domain-containing protein [Streptomyces sp. NPDC005151]